MILYHLSPDPQLPRILKPRLPVVSYNGEPKVNRICVSTSILGCIRSRFLCSVFDEYPLYLFRIHNTSPIVKPRGVYDSDICKELWVTSRSRAELLGRVVNRKTWTTQGPTNTNYGNNRSKYMGEYTVEYLNGNTITYLEKIGTIKSIRRKCNGNKIYTMEN